jgi:hypothetical protein
VSLLALPRGLRLLNLQREGCQMKSSLDVLLNGLALDKLLIQTKDSGSLTLNQITELVTEVGPRVKALHQCFTTVLPKITELDRRIDALTNLNLKALTAPKKAAPKNTGRPKAITTVDIQRIIHYYVNRRWSSTKLAKKFGISHQTVLTYLTDADVKIRTRGRPANTAGPAHEPSPVLTSNPKSEPVQPDPTPEVYPLGTIVYFHIPTLNKVIQHKPDEGKRDEKDVNRPFICIDRKGDFARFVSLTGEGKDGKRLEIQREWSAGDESGSFWFRKSYVNGAEYGGAVDQFKQADQSNGRYNMLNQVGLDAINVHLWNKGR